MFNLLQKVFRNYLGDTTDYEPCEDNYAADYLNQESVKKAILQIFNEQI